MTVRSGGDGLRNAEVKKWRRKRRNLRSNRCGSMMMMGFNTKLSNKMMVGFDRKWNWA